MLDAARNDEYLARAENDVTVTQLDLELTVMTRKSSSVSSWVCHTNSPLTFTTLIS